MQHTQSAGGVIVNAKTGKIVLVNQNGDSWSFPKGHLEYGEIAMSAALREIKEETGLTQLDFVRPLGSFERPKIALGGKGDDVTEFKVITMFLFTTPQTELKPSDPRIPEARWVDRGKVVGMLTHVKDQEFMLHVLETLE